jgi:hypothetical protein
MLYTPWAAELVKARRAEQRTNDPVSHCLPIGIIRLHTVSILKKTIQVPGLLAILIQDRTTSYRSQSVSFSRRSIDLSLRGTAALRAGLTPSNTAGTS